MTPVPVSSISQDEKAAGKKPPSTPPKLLRSSTRTSSRNTPAEKAADTAIADLKQQMAVLKANLEQTQAALNDEKGKAKDASHAHSNAAAGSIAEAMRPAQRSKKSRKREQPMRNSSQHRQGAAGGRREGGGVVVRS